MAEYFKRWESGSQNAWILVQHADHDVEFQEHCLNLMKELPTSKVSIQNIVYLEDRVRVNRGAPQIYGTQGRLDERGAWVPRDIADLSEVDRRRNEVGLENLEVYVRYMNRKYEKPPVDEYGED